MDLSKHIPLLVQTEEELEEAAGDDDSSVATDLVIERKGHPFGIVVPLKITTRERIVQPFAHQRILDGRFGEGRYKSMLLCMSETQLDDKSKSVKQICVPGTIRLFQKYLAKIDGIYYADPPARYLAKDISELVRVGDVGDFFHDLLGHMAQETQKANAG